MCYTRALLGCSDGFEASFSDYLSPSAPSSEEERAGRRRRDHVAHIGRSAFQTAKTVFVHSHHLGASGLVLPTLDLPSDHGLRRALNHLLTTHPCGLRPHLPLPSPLFSRRGFPFSFRFPNLELSFPLPSPTRMRADPFFSPSSAVNFSTILKTLLTALMAR